MATTGNLDFIQVCGRWKQITNYCRKLPVTEDSKEQLVIKVSYRMKYIGEACVRYTMNEICKLHKTIR